MKIYKWQTKIECPSNPYRDEKDIEINYFVMEDGRPLPIQWAGCDDANGSDACLQCQAEVTENFYNSPPPQVLRRIGALSHWHTPDSGSPTSES